MDDSKRMAWLKSQLERGFNIEFIRELTELDDDTSGLCILVYRFPQSGPEEGCGTCIGGNTDFHTAIDEAMAYGT